MLLHRALRTLALSALPGVLALGALTASPALADGGSLRVSGDGVHVARLAPGRSGSGTFEVTNASSYDARLDLAATDVVDHENGCLRQETRVPSEHCDADGGELGGELEVTLAHDGQTVWAGGMAALEEGVTLTSHLAPGATWPVTLTVALPMSSGNETMTDETSFGLRLTATGQGGTTQVDAPGVHVGAGGAPPPGGMRTPLRLPLTGATLPLWVLLLDGAVLLAGAVLVLAGRRRRTFA